MVYCKRGSMRLPAPQYLEGPVSTCSALSTHRIGRGYWAATVAHLSGNIIALEGTRSTGEAARPPEPDKCDQFHRSLGTHQHPHTSPTIRTSGTASIHMPAM